MGCGSSKSSASKPKVATRERGLIKKTPPKAVNGTGSHLTNSFKRRENSFQADLPGAVPENVTDAMPAPVSFEIPANEDGSLIKKHPPRRLQKLEEQQIPVTTHERLAEKQMSAKDRRQKMLQDRVQSSRRSMSRAGQHVNTKGSLAISEQIEHYKMHRDNLNYDQDADINEF